MRTLPRNVTGLIQRCDQIQQHTTLNKNLVTIFVGYYGITGRSKGTESVSFPIKSRKKKCYFLHDFYPL